MSIHDSRKIEDVKVMLIKGADGNSISTIEKTSTSGLVDTYTVTLTDGSQTTFTVTNGSSIESITKTSTSGLTDTYTVTLTNGETSTFQVTNAKSITSIDKTSTSGLVDTYTITYNDGTTSTFTVTNGAGVDIVDNLNSTDPDKGLSANQGHELKGQIDDAQGNIATIEPTNTASQAYAVGEFLVYDGKLHKVTQAIAQGDTLTLGTNIVLDTVGSELSAINSKLLEKQELGVIQVGNTLNIDLSGYGTNVLMAELCDSEYSYATNLFRIAVKNRVEFYNFGTSSWMVVGVEYNNGVVTTTNINGASGKSIRLWLFK